jgi:hypothetical protein
VPHKPNAMDQPSSSCVTHTPGRTNSHFILYKCFQTNPQVNILQSILME